MLIKKRYTGTRLGLGDVDPVQPLNTEHPLLRDVQGFWLPLPHLGGGQRLYDLSAKKSAGTLEGAVSWESTGKRLGRVLAYPGDGASFVRHTETSNIVSHPFSGFALFRTGGVQKVILSQWDESPGVDVWYIGIWNTGVPGEVILFSRKGGDSTFLRSITPYNDNEWHFLTFTLNSGVIANSSIYVDGDSNSEVVQNPGLSLAGGYEWRVRQGRREADGTRDWDGSLGATGLFDCDWSHAQHQAVYDQARRGFPDLLNRRPAMTVVDMAVVPPPGDTIEATADPSLAADYAAALQPTPATLAATADLTLAQDYAAAIGTQPDAIQATADASLSADYAALLQPQPVTLQATPDASGASDYAGAIQPTPVTLSASSDLSLAQDYAATITEVDAPVVIEASADLSLGADYAASVVAVPVMISIGFDAGLGADFAAFLSDSSASQTVQARISTGERFTSNTSSSERVS